MYPYKPNRSGEEVEIVFLCEEKAREDVASHI